jgi:hypothetical protein
MKKSLIFQIAIALVATVALPSGATAQTAASTGANQASGSQVTTVAQSQLDPNAKKTVVVIDSGFDTSKFSPIAEVCILTVKRCNNGQAFDESVGASTTSLTMTKNGQKEWRHGTIMADIVRQINPHVNLILIRNAFVVPSGAVNIGGIKEFNLSMDWVIKNKEKYNIAAVSFSRGQITWTQKSTTCPIDTTTQNQIVTLQNLGVATVMPAGNNRNKTNISYPACIAEAVAISGIYSQNYTPKIFSTYRETHGTNSGAATDFFAMGNFKTVAGPVAESTSASTAAFAGHWSKVTNGNYFETYAKIASTMTAKKYVDVLATPR